MENNLNAVNNLGQSYYIEPKEKISNKKKDDMSTFSEMEYTSKLDGKTYVARKVPIKTAGKEAVGIIVFEKDAKPDENGNIKTELMSVEKFMRKLGYELPSLSANHVKAYNPNIKAMSPEEKFDRGLANGVKLSDGSTLVRPNFKNNGLIEIRSLDSGLYEIKTTSYVGAQKQLPKISVISEKQLLGNKFLCAGTIKELDDGSFDIRSFDHEKTKNKVTVINQDKEYCINMMETNFVRF